MYGSPVIMAAATGLRMDSAAFVGALSRFQESSAQSRTKRGDSIGAVMRSYREQINARRIDEAIRSNSVDGRADGFSANAGFHLARDLEFVHAEVLEEEFPLPNALRLFSESGTVPVGANTHTMRRVFSHGEARVYRGPGDKIPRVGATQREETWPIRHLVAGYGWDIFEAASANFANSGLLTKNARDARDAIMELANRLWWQGSEIHQLYGVLNYPWLPKKDIATGFSRATVTASPDTVLGELNDLVNFPHDESKSVFQPTVLAMTNALRDVLSSVRFAAGSDTTILEQFLKNSAHIKRVEVAWELEDAGGAGIDGMLAYRDDQRGIQIVMPQGITQLPIQEKGLESEVINYASIGGVVMPDVLNNILGFANTSA